MAEVKICEYCGRLYEPARSDSRYCSGACRTRACRQRKRLQRLVPTSPPDLGDMAPGLVDAVHGARRVSHDFARISATGPVKARAGALRVADAIAAALDREGW